MQTISAQVSTKYQVVLPKALREALRIGFGVGVADLPLEGDTDLHEPDGPGRVVFLPLVVTTS